MPHDRVVTPELARYITELSSDMGRQIGLLIARSDAVTHVIVGDARGILLPDLSDYPIGRKTLRGLRFVHTHLKDEPLTQDDLTDLALLRFDAVAAVGLRDDQPDRIYIAHLLPQGAGRPHEVLPPEDFYNFRFDFIPFVTALEDELERARGFEVSGLAGRKGAGAGKERAILVSVSTKPRYEQEDSVEELKELALSSDVVVLEAVIQRPKEINPKYLMGEGKIKEVVIQALQLGATLLIFDQDLSPAQVRSISEITDLKVIDRSQLILDIFARRAHTLDGKVQVELAQLKYILPRLVGKGTAFSRLMGGIGGRGPGETKLETDRRRLRDRIGRLEKQLEMLARGRMQRRQKRVRAGLPNVSIVGYTNAGKSTLLNALTESSVFTEDLLFATLDTSTRRLRFPLEREVIITDTVGFFRQLPKSLVGAFKATLEELEDADLLLHVVDLAHPRFEEQIRAVERILQDLELDRIPRLLVFNKVDLVPEGEIGPLCRRFGAIAVSARERRSFGPLLTELERRFWPAEA